MQRSGFGDFAASQRLFLLSCRNRENLCEEISAIPLHSLVGHGLLGSGILSLFNPAIRSIKVGTRC
jgi:hypothetical protein